MTKTRVMQHRFVDDIPGTVQEGILYVSREYGTAVHKCCCGCGHEVVTPLGPTDWRVTVGRSGVCVYPSIGNWSFACRSHYWINHGRVQWAEQWSDEWVRAGRLRDQEAKRRQYDESARQNRPGFWPWLWHLITGR